MKRTNIGKTSSGTNNCKGSIRITPVEKQPGILFARVILLLLIGIEIVKYCLAIVYFVYHMVNCANDNFRFNMAVIWHERTNIAQLYVIRSRIIITR